MKTSVNLAILSIILLAGLVMFGLAGISYFTHNMRDTQQQAVLEVEHLNQTLGQMEVEFLRARRAEKDFLLRRDEKYVERHANTMVQLNEISTSLMAQLPQVDGMQDQLASLTQLDAAVAAYEQSFAALVQSHRTLGLDEKSGLQGALRGAVHNIEESLSEFNQPEMQVKMLMMRRHEKDFIMRQASKYLDRLNARVEEFRAFPDDYYANANQRSQMEALLTSYQASFASYVTESMSEKELRKELSARFAETEPLLVAIHAAASKQLEHILATSQITSAAAKRDSLLASAIGSGLFLVLAFFLARSIARPLGRLNLVLQGIMRGDFAHSVPKSGLSEIASICSAVEIFRSSEMKKDQLTQDISQVISACAEGDFSRRISADEDAGTFAELGQGVNAIGTAAQKGLGDVLSALAALSEGDLTKRMPEGQKGVFKEISDAIDGLNDSLGGMVRQLASSSDLLNNTSTEIAAAADDASRRSERTAASIVETAASLQTLGGSVTGTAQNSQQARSLVGDAQNRAVATQDIAQQTNEAMKRIEESSVAIAKINGLIEDVAFQTSLLALNAGVEAARAGEAGRGFAVVASEVRALAHRSAAAAQEISDLISKSEKEVADGVKLVNETGTSLKTILSLIDDVVGRVNEIAETTVEQSNGISEVNATVEELDRDAQKNAAMLEQTAASGQMLRNEASNLVQIVSGFELPEGAGNTASVQNNPDVQAA